MTASVVAFLDSDRSAQQISQEAEFAAKRTRCEHAYLILTDDALNSGLSAVDRDRLIIEELSMASDCRGIR